jgi:hypothetical protein
MLSRVTGIYRLERLGSDDGVVGAASRQITGI